MTSSGRGRLLGAGIAVLALVAPASAAATTVYPAGGSFAGAAGSTIQLNSSSYSIRCSLSGSTANVPAAPGNSGTGAVALRFVPALSSCVTVVPAGAPVDATTSGTWSMGLSWGLPQTGTISVPASGLRFTIRLTPGGSILCTVQFGAGTITGTWSNGIASPVVDSSLYALSGRLSATSSCMEPSWQLQSSASAITFTDATSSGNVLLVGP
jgi:hypothetical protein